MIPNASVSTSTNLTIASTRYGYLLKAFCSGLLIPFGFAPFHIPGAAILGIAFLYAQLQGKTSKQSFLTGFSFGLGFLGLGVSWFYISIHEYGHLNTFFSAFITLLFVMYLSIYPGLVAFLFHKLSKRRSLFLSCVLFSALWCSLEYLRATFMGGFPWLLLGFGQIDTPLKYLLPMLGVYGVGFFACLAATCLVSMVQTRQWTRYLWLVSFIGILLTPSVLKNKQWSVISDTPVSVCIIQANLSMRDKWDESLFWQLLQQYKQDIKHLIGKKQLIVMPESAIPVPASYISDFIETTHQQATHAGSAILLGIPEPTSADETYYYNTIMSLGSAQGHYVKQHLVPFGEFIPQPFQKIIYWLGVPSANLKPGKNNQALIEINHHPIATLICYELAYPQLLRKQLPEAEWIVSISDDGWFGKSLAMYQQVQMAQALSIQSGRFQVVSNNDGLSSIIDAQGTLISSLPALSSGILEADIYPATGSTPWIYFGDLPILFASLLIVLLAQFTQYYRRRPSS